MYETTNETEPLPLPLTVGAARDLRAREAGIVSTLADLLREVLRSGDESGVMYVRNTHVPEETFARLAYLTHDHAFDAGKEGSSAGERIYEGGILPWWRAEGGLSDLQIGPGGNRLIGAFRVCMVERTGNERR